MDVKNVNPPKKVLHTIFGYYYCNMYCQIELIQSPSRSCLTIRFLLSHLYLVSITTSSMYSPMELVLSTSRPCLILWFILSNAPFVVAVCVFGQGAASGVRVNSVALGHVETPIYGGLPLEMLQGITKSTQLIGRPIQPEEVKRCNFSTNA